MGGHPVLGGRLPLSIPPEAMDQGLFGELSVQPVTLLSPCVLQYPNLLTQLTHIKISFADFITFLYVSFMKIIRGRSPVLGASGSNLCYLQRRWFSWLHQTLTSVRSGTVLQLSLRAAGVRVSTSQDCGQGIPSRLVVSHFSKPTSSSISGSDRAGTTPVKASCHRDISLYIV